MSAHDDVQQRDLDFASHKATHLGAASDPGDAPRWDQIPTTLVWSWGGPFCFPLVEFDVLPCPTCDPAPFEDLAPSGVLSFDIPPGDYHVMIRGEVRGLISGARLVGLYRPDLADPTTEYLVRGFTLPVMLGNCGNPQLASGDLFARKTVTGPAGIRLLGWQGKGPITPIGSCASGGQLFNLQVAFAKVAGFTDMTPMVPALPFSSPCPPVVA